MADCIAYQTAPIMLSAKPSTLGVLYRKSGNATAPTTVCKAVSISNLPRKYLYAQAQSLLLQALCYASCTGGLQLLVYCTWLVM